MMIGVPLISTFAIYFGRPRVPRISAPNAASGLYPAADRITEATINPKTIDTMVAVIGFFSIFSIVLSI